MITLVLTSTIYFLKMIEFEDDNYFFIPLITGILFTVIRFSNHISEKKILSDQLNLIAENGLHEDKINFLTCPDYWTKVTTDNNVFCHNYHIDKNNKEVNIGKVLKQNTTDSNIGYEFSNVGSSVGSSVRSSVGNSNTDNIIQMRSNAVYRSNQIVEQFGEDSDLHQHKFTLLSHIDVPPKWEGDIDYGEHDAYRNNDNNHIMTVNMHHSHGARGQIRNMTISSLQDTNYETQPNSNSNNDHWISPYIIGNKIHAEINLTKLNTAKNKCDLAGQFAWDEANVKCGAINKKFDL
jgi:hypothetical protein